MTPRTNDFPNSPGPKRFRVNWTAVGVVTAIALGLLGWLRDDSHAFAKDYSSLQDRVTILETQRGVDVKRLERMEDKIDRLLERSR